MSASNKESGAAQATAGGSALNDELVRDYLKDNSNFLRRNPDMMDHLHIPHASGSAVSLVEKQVSVLRERNMDMRHRLKTLTGNARDNDKLYEQTRALILRLLEADSIDALHQAFVESMETHFDVDHATMILFGDDQQAASCRVESLESAKNEIGALLKARKALCGPLREQELSYLFPHAGEVGSAALVPLSNGAELGLIAVGSSDPNRYNSAMGTLFLSHIADVIVRLLPRLSQQQA